MNAGQKTLERFMGAPLAAPETAAMRRMRRAWTASMFVAALLLTASSFGPVWLTSVLAPLDGVALAASVLLGYTFLTRKRSIDDAWLRSQVSKGGDA